VNLTSPLVTNKPAERLLYAGESLAFLKQNQVNHKELYESIHPGRTITRNCHL